MSVEEIIGLVLLLVIAYALITKYFTPPKKPRLSLEEKEKFMLNFFQTGICTRCNEKCKTFVVEKMPYSTLDIQVSYTCSCINTIYLPILYHREQTKDLYHLALDVYNGRIDWVKEHKKKENEKRKKLIKQIMQEKELAEKLGVPK